VKTVWVWVLIGHFSETTTTLNVFEDPADCEKARILQDSMKWRDAQGRLEDPQFDCSMQVFHPRKNSARLSK
jgi:hypothetical protein